MAMESYDNIIVGTGEIGMPLYELMNGVYETLPVDIVHFKDNTTVKAKCKYLHICLPGELSNFDKLVLDYYKKYTPRIVFIHSTLIPGTTRLLNVKLGKDIIIHCPVHGKHQNNCMKRDMLWYPKYLGIPLNMDKKYVSEAVKHFEKMGFTTVIIQKGTDTTEWAKIISTTAFGVQVAFMQEVERICDKFNLNYDDVAHFLPIQDGTRGPLFPGFIGGHCVIPNIKIIKKIYESSLLDWVEWSNEEKQKRDEVEVDGRGR